MDFIVCSLEEKKELKKEKMERVTNALIEIAEIQEIVKNTKLKYTKEILFEELKRVVYKML